MTYRIAFFSDTHLEYGTRCKVNPRNGINMRVWDGFVGLNETVTSILEHDVNLVVHGGDLFHRSNPGVTAIVYARQQFSRFTAAGINVVSNTGNHDFANERSRMSANAVIRTPGGKITDVHEPTKIITPEDGLNIYVVSHVGLLGQESPELTINPNDVNVFTSHGAAQIPGHDMFKCADSPGEAVIGYDILSLPWNVGLLGHYHRMDPLPGFNTGDTGQIWYAGSLLRRGFSDPEGGRGWLLVTIEADGKTTIERKFVKQRPQHDLPLIDASNLNSTEVEERIIANLGNVEIPDSIIRQKVVNISPAIRRHVATNTIGKLTVDALTWQLEYSRPLKPEVYDELHEDHAAIASIATAAQSNLPHMWDDWIEGWTENQGIPPEMRTIVAEKGKVYLEEVTASAGPATTD